MGALDKIKGLFSTKGAVKFPSRYSGVYLSKISSVNNYDENARTYIERGYQDNPVVYSVVSDVAKSFSMAKWGFRDKDTKKDIRNPQLTRLFESPSPGKSINDFHQEAVTHRMLQGNSFDVMEMASENGLNEGKPQYLYTLPAEDIQIIPTQDRMGIAGYQVDNAWSEGSMIPATDVMHLRNPNPDFDEPDNFLFGQSDFRAAFRSIQAYNESLETGVWYLQNKGAQKLLYNESDDELSPEATDALKTKLRQQTQGPKNAANIPIIDGKLGVVDVSTNPQEVLVLEQRHQAAKEICNVVNYPCQLLGLNDATYQNAKEAKKAKWEQVIIPLLEERMAGYNHWLAPKFGKNVEIYYDVSHIDALQEDKINRGEAITKFAGMITINQALALAGLPTYDWMKEPTNMEEFREQLYVGFTQAVISDNEEISDINKETEE